MFCAQCGARLFPQARFCRACGFAVLGDVPSPSAIAAAVLPISHPEVVTLGESRFILVGFGRRFAGRLIDIVFLLTVQSMAAFAVGWNNFSSSNDLSEVRGGVVVPILIQLSGLVYYWVGNAIGQTLGKAACGMRVVKDNGRRPGIGTGFARMVVETVSWLSLGVGVLWCIWDGKKQTWHDKLASTYVVEAE